jgi:hypothetical protein
MPRLKNAIYLILLSSPLFAMPRMAVALDCIPEEDPECQPPPCEECEPQPLSCPQTLPSCQTHYGPATLVMNRLHVQSSLTFDQALVDADDLGDPTYEGGTNYLVCIYGAEGLLTGWSAAAGMGYSFIDNKPERGIRYRNVKAEGGMKSLLARPDSHVLFERKEKQKKPPSGRLASSSFNAPDLPIDP